MSFENIPLYFSYIVVGLCSMAFGYVLYAIQMHNALKLSRERDDESPEELANDWALDYKPWEENLTPQQYAEYGFVAGYNRARDKFQPPSESRSAKEQEG